MKLDLYLTWSWQNLKVNDIHNDDIRLRPNSRVFDTPSLEVERLDSTVPEAEMMNFRCMRSPEVNSWDTWIVNSSNVWIKNYPNHGLNWPLYTCKADSTTKQTMRLQHCCQNILPAWRIMWVKKWVMMHSLSKHNSAAMEKWWCSTGNGVIRVRMDDNKRGLTTHRVKW